MKISVKSVFYAIIFLVYNFVAITMSNSLLSAQSDIKVGLGFTIIILTFLIDLLLIVKVLRDK